MFNELRDQVKEVQLIPGAKGAFEVAVDGNLVFSKLEQGRFPNHSEILAAMASP